MAIDPERLLLVPEAYRDQHSFCFWLHDMMLDVLQQAEAARVADLLIHFDAQEAVPTFSDAEDLLNYLRDTGRTDILKRIVLNQVVIPLYGDLIHFVFEGLKSLEKRKYAVAFTLLRKPFKYSLMFATWLLADEDDFFRRLSIEPSVAFDERKITSERRLELLRRAIAQLPDNEFLDAATIVAMAFDRRNVRGLAQYFDKAAHLVTSYPSMRTEDMNLNFIFKDPRDTDVYEGVYPLIAYLLMYLLHLELATIGKMREIPAWYNDWVRMATLAPHVALFTDASDELLGEVNELLGEMLSCALCGTEMAITKENVLIAFSHERITCSQCATEQQIPLFWLMSRFSKVKDKATAPGNGGPHSSADRTAESDAEERDVASQEKPPADV